MESLREASGGCGDCGDCGDPPDEMGDFEYHRMPAELDRNVPSLQQSVPPHLKSRTLTAHNDMHTAAPVGTPGHQDSHPPTPAHQGPPLHTHTTTHAQDRCHSLHSLALWEDDDPHLRSFTGGLPVPAHLFTDEHPTRVLEAVKQKDKGRGVSGSPSPGLH